MKNTIFFALFLVLGTATSWAQDFATRMVETYRETDRNYDLDCIYSYNKTYQLATPVGETVKNSDSLGRKFEIDNGKRTINLDFSVKIKDGKAVYEAVFDKTVVVAGSIKNRDFYLPQLTDRNLQTEFETNKIMCSVNFATALPYVLEDGNYHINVHPHTIYDWQNRLKAPIEKYLNDDTYNSLILLEAGNVRGNLVNIANFFAGKEPNLPLPNYTSILVEVPLSTPLIVSPAGNSRYDIQAQSEINIVFSGGNHNYCIWNVARHVLENLLNSKSSAEINFRYDMSAIVAQVNGVERTGINFPRNSVAKSNLLRDLLSEKAVQVTYHKNYLHYFSTWLADEYIGMYRTYTVDYEGPGFKETRTYQGKGTRDLKVTFRYF